MSKQDRRLRREREANIKANEIIDDAFEIVAKAIGDEANRIREQVRAEKKTKEYGNGTD